MMPPDQAALWEKIRKARPKVSTEEELELLWYIGKIVVLSRENKLVENTLLVISFSFETDPENKDRYLIGFKSISGHETEPTIVRNKMWTHTKNIDDILNALREAYNRGKHFTELLKLKEKYTISV